MTQEQDIYTTRTMPNGAIWYYKNGKHHRDDGPAIENANGGGGYAWFLNGKYHREDGPAIEDANGSKQWLIDGKYHREGGPAIEEVHPTRGKKEWWVHGKRHRVEGPAVEWADEVMFEAHNEWWRNGERIDVRLRILLPSKTSNFTEHKVTPIIYLKVR